MFKFAAIRRILGNIKVTQDDKEITISGIPTRTMTSDIERVWNTTRINKHMFSRISRNSISFPPFFALDVYYMLDVMTKEPGRYTNVRTLTKIKELLLVDTWLRDTVLEPTPRVDLNRLKNMVYTPLDYQQEFLETYDKITQQYHLKGNLLAAAAGSGKTFVALALAECLNSDLIVVVCPKNAIHRVWENEVKSLFKKPQTYWMSTHSTPYKNERIAVVHYEYLAKFMTVIKGRRSKVPVLVLDESHNLNEIDSLRTRQFIELAGILDTRDVVYASGTAFKSIGAEAIPMLRCIDPYFTQDAEARFKKIYGSSGNRGLDILNHRIGKISYKVEKHQLGLDKPIIKRLPVVIPDGQKYTLSAIRKDMQAFIEERAEYYKKRRKDDEALYNRCMDIHSSKVVGPESEAALAAYRSDVGRIQKAGGDARVVSVEMQRANDYEKRYILPSLPQELREEFKDVKSIIKYTNLKIQGEALGRVLGRKRIECHVDMVPHIDFMGVCESTPKKTIVFTSFVDALEAAYNHLDKLGLNPLKVYGKTNNELSRIVEVFDKQEDMNPLIATYQSLSTAVPLVMADTMIMIDSPFRSYIREQAISRIHRLGADTQTTVWECHLDTGNEPNISTRSKDIMEWSQQQVESILGLKSQFDIQEDAGELTVSSEMYDIESKVSIKEVVTEVVSSRPTYLDW